MKTVIFAGGFGSRIAEESYLKPKPMIEIGGKPIIWHIMKMYESYGYNEFIVCLGYKGYMIKEYFLNYFMHHSDVTVDLSSNSIEVHKSKQCNFKVTLVDTGYDTGTAGRLKKVQDYIGRDKEFMLTYGDGVSDVDISSLVKFHRKHGRIATVTSVQPEGKYGGINVNNTGVVNVFREKPKGDSNWINGGFFVLKSEIFGYLGEGDLDGMMWEEKPILELVRKGELMAYRHDGFWKCMDAMRDKMELEEMWKNNPKWKVW